MGQRVLERVFDFREQLGFVDEFGGLQLRQPFAEGIARHVGDCLKQRQRHVLADHGGRLQQSLVLGGEPIDARGQDRLHCGRHLNGFRRVRQPIGAGFANEGGGLDQRAHALLEK
jgi:hypothetical protein